jgi:hypothetical protein
MDPITSPVSEIFTLPFVLTLGITCALVVAVAVILYNKILHQGEKLAAVMELSTVLAQEVRSHEMILKHGQHVQQSTDSPILAEQRRCPINPLGYTSSNRVYVSDGPDDSDDEESDDESIPLAPRNVSSALDNIILNPMFVGTIGIPETRVVECESDGDEDDSSDDDDISIDDDDISSDDDDISIDDEEGSSGSISSIVILPDDMENLGGANHSDALVVEDIDFSKNDSRVITLTDIAIAPIEGEYGVGIDEICVIDDTDTHKVVVDSGNHVVDYKKLSANDLKRIAIDRGVLEKGAKMKKNELVELLSSL